MLNKGHKSKKCTVDSDPLPQIHASLGVSLNLCLYLWAFSALNPALSWYKYLRFGLWILKILFLSGLIIPINLLNLLNLLNLIYYDYPIIGGNWHNL